MASHPVHRTRTALCDLLDSLSDEQWSAETLCAGWDSGDMVNHLIARERGTITSLGILVSPLEGLHEWAMDRVGRRSRDTRIAMLRSGPTPWFRYGPGADVQVGEDWIHTQDIVRGGAAQADGAALEPRDGGEDPAVRKLLWKAVGRFAPMTLSRSTAEGVVELTDGTTSRTYRVGGALARPAKGQPADVTITAPVGELALWVTGRDAARVQVQGDGALHDELASSDRGF